jgi:hypothetical protein
MVRVTWCLECSCFNLSSPPILTRSWGEHAVAGSSDHACPMAATCTRPISRFVRRAVSQRSRPTNQDASSRALSRLGTSTLSPNCPGAIGIPRGSESLTVLGFMHALPRSHR